MTSTQPAVSVVVPVFERPSFLRRALASVARQSLQNFECLVVDDASAGPIEPVVQEFDDRFVYIRRDTNGGAVAARLSGYRKAAAPHVANLDSDDELLPRALEHAVALLEERPAVDAVVGLSAIGGELPLRIRGGEHVVAPEEYLRRSPPPFDLVGVFRSEVARRWADKLPPFFKEEFALWLTLGLDHRVLYVDEQWGIHHSDAPSRLSSNFEDGRWLDDLRAFIDHFRPRIGAEQCAPLDQYLVHRYFLLLRRGHRAEAGLVADWLNERRIGLMQRARIVLRTRRDRRTYRF